jgi:hypothetical protein
MSATADQLTKGISVYVGNLRVKLTENATVGKVNPSYVILTGYRVYRNTGRMSDHPKAYPAHLDHIIVIGGTS